MIFYSRLAVKSDFTPLVNYNLRDSLSPIQQVTALRHHVIPALRHCAHD